MARKRNHPLDCARKRTKIKSRTSVKEEEIERYLDNGPEHVRVNF